MQANTANEHSDAPTHLPTMPVASKSRVRAPGPGSLVSYRTLAWNFQSSKQAVDASKYREPSPERLIKDDEQA